MSLLGFTFGFGARDMGMRSGIDAATRGLSGVIDSVAQLSSDLRGRVGRGIDDFFQGLQNITMGGVLDAIQELGGSSSNLTNSLEAQWTQMDQSTRRFTAQLGMMGAEGRRARGEINSLAYSMNVGADSVAQNFVLMEETTDGVRLAFEHMGLGLEELTQLSEGAGVDVGQLTNILGDLIHSWGMTSDVAGDTVDNFIAMAQSAGLGMQAMDLLNGSLSALDEVYAGSSIERGPEDIARLMNSMVAGASAFRSFGVGGQEAVQSIDQLFRVMAQEQVQFERAMQGLGDEAFGPLGLALSELSGNSDWAQQLMESDPTDMMRWLNEIFTRGTLTLNGVTREVGNNEVMMGRLRQTVNETMGANAAFLLTSEEGARALESMVPPLNDAAGAMANLADESFSTGITLAESLERAQLSFETRLRGISRGPVRDFVREQRRAYRRVGDSLVDLSSDETWGPLIGRMSAMHSLGLAGLFVDLSEGAEGANGQFAEMAAMLSFVSSTGMSAVASLAPLATVVAGFGPILRSAFGFLAPITSVLFSWPVLLIGAAVALIAFRDEIGPAFNRVADVLADAAGWLNDFIKSLDPVELANSLFEILEFIPVTIYRFVTGDPIQHSKSASAMGGAFSRMFETAWTFTRTFFTTLGARVSTAIADTDWGVVATELLAAWQRVTAFVWEKIRDLAGVIAGVINKVDWVEVGNALVSGWETSMDLMGEAVVTLVQGIDWNRVKDALVAGFVGALSRVGEGVRDIFSGEGTGADFGVVAMAAGAFARLLPILTTVGSVFTSIAGPIWTVASTVGGFLFNSLTSIGGALRALTVIVAGVIGWPATIAAAVIGILGAWQVLPDGIREMITGAINRVSEWLLGALVSVGEFSGRLRKWFSEVDVSAAIRGFAEDLVQRIRNLFVGDGEGSIGQTVSNALHNIDWERVLVGIGAIFTTVINAFRIAAFGIPRLLREVFIGLVQGAAAFLPLIAEGMWELFTGALGVIWGLFDFLSDVFERGVITPFMGWLSRIWERHVRAPMARLMEIIRTAIIDPVAGWLERAGDNIRGFVNGVRERIESVGDGIRGFWDGIRNAVGGVIDFIQGAIQRVVDTARNIIDGFINIYNVIAEHTPGLEPMRTLGQRLAEEQAQSMRDELFNQFTDQQFAESMAAAMEMPFASARDLVGQILSEGRPITQGLIDSLREQAPEVADELVRTLASTAEAISSVDSPYLPDIFTNVDPDVFSDTLSRVLTDDAASHLHELMRGAGENVTEEMGLGISESWASNIDGPMADLMSMTTDQLPMNSPPEDPESPWADLRGVGFNFWDEIRIGLTDEWPNFNASLSEMLAASAEQAVESFVLAARTMAASRITDTVDALASRLESELGQAQVETMLAANPNIQTDVAQEVIARAEIRDLIVAIYDVAGQQMAVLNEIRDNTFRTAQNTEVRGEGMASILQRTSR